MNQTAARDSDLDLLRAVDPAGGETLTASDAAALRLKSIERGRVINSSAFPRRRRPSPTLRLAAVAVCASAVVVLALVGINGPGGGEHPDYAAGAVQVAEANPRLLVTAPGWTVSRVNFSSPTEGDMTFSDGTRNLEATWYPAARYQSYLQDRSSSSELHATEVTVNGQPGTLVAYPSHDDYELLLQPQDGAFLGLRSLGASEDEFLSVAQSLRAVSVDDWLAAMPPSAVEPADTTDVVDQMLRDIPLPPGFDTHQLENSAGLVVDRYQLGATVTSAVAGAWVARWKDAMRTGDTAAADRAVQALASSRDWNILREMQPQGGFSGTIWDCAQFLASDRASLLLDAPPPAAALREAQVQAPPGATVEMADGPCEFSSP